MDKVYVQVKGIGLIVLLLSSVYPIWDSLFSICSGLQVHDAPFISLVSNCSFPATLHPFQFQSQF
jgi:hypothetical protein